MPWMICLLICLWLIQFTHKVASLLWVWNSRLQVTQNVITALEWLKPFLNSYWDITTNWCKSKTEWKISYYSGNWTLYKFSIPSIVVKLDWLSFTYFLFGCVHALNFLGQTGINNLVRTFWKDYLWLQWIRPGYCTVFHSDWHWIFFA